MTNVKSLIPLDKHDIERAEAVIDLGYPTIDPILPELLEWLQDMNHPVAGVLAPFLASIGRPLIPHIRHIMKTDDGIWKYWIIKQIIRDSYEIAKEFRTDFERLAYSPTEIEVEEGLNEEALAILHKYKWEKNF